MENNWEIFEIAPKPSKFTLELLDLIYNQNGPIDKVYKKYHVDYRAKKFLIYKDNNLWTDKNIEKQTLPLNIRNILFLSLIKIGNFKLLFEKLNDRINSKKEVPAAEWNNMFLQDYELVFETNLLFNKAIKNLETVLREHKEKMPTLLSFGNDAVAHLSKIEIKPPTQKMLGNSIEVMDRGKFCAIKYDHKENDELKRWWDKLPEYKQVVYQKSLRTAQIYSRLREYGRWLVVKDISIIRKYMEAEAKEKMCKLEELAGWKPDERDSESEITFDNTIKSESLRTVGVSVGRATGILVSPDQVEKNIGKKIILYTPYLAPDLTNLLDKVEGVVSTNGSVMSHLAIVAREMNKPMIIGVMLHNNLNIGDEVQIDGINGKVEKI